MIEGASCRGLQRLLPSFSHDCQPQLRAWGCKSRRFYSQQRPTPSPPVGARAFPISRKTAQSIGLYRGGDADRVRVRGLFSISYPPSLKSLAEVRLHFRKMSILVSHFLTLMTCLEVLISSRRSAFFKKKKTFYSSVVWNHPVGGRLSCSHLNGFVHVSSYLWTQYFKF